MATQYTIDRVADLASITKVRRESFKQARTEMLDAMREAREDGHTLATIGNAIGSSRQYVHLLLNSSTTKENNA